MFRYITLAACFLLTACGGLDRLAKILPDHPNHMVILGTSEFITHPPSGEAVSHKAIITLRSRCIHSTDPEFETLRDAGRHGLPRGNTIRSTYITIHMKDYMFAEAVSFAFDSLEVENREKYVIGGWNASNPAIIKPQPGGVIYIGHIIFDYNDGIISVRREDRLDDFSRSHSIPSAWQGKIQKRFFDLPKTINLRQLAPTKGKEDVCK